MMGKIIQKWFSGRIEKPVYPSILVFLIGECLDGRVDIHSLIGNSIVDSYLITETNVIPSADNIGWSTVKPTEYIFK